MPTGYDPNEWEGSANAAFPLDNYGLTKKKAVTQPLALDTPQTIAEPAPSAQAPPAAAPAEQISPERAAILASRRVTRSTPRRTPATGAPPAAPAPASPVEEAFEPSKPAPGLSPQQQQQMAAMVTSMMPKWAKQRGLTPEQYGQFLAQNPDSPGAIKLRNMMQDQSRSPMAP